METQEQNKEEQQQPENEFIRIGDITLASSNKSTEELLDLVEQILKNKTIKEYLEFKKNSRVAGMSYFG